MRVEVEEEDEEAEEEGEEEEDGNSMDFELPSQRRAKRLQDLGHTRRATFGPASLVMFLVASFMCLLIAIYHFVRRLRTVHVSQRVRMNIVLFEADQVRPDAHQAAASPGRLAAVTPNLDSIAAEGVRFTSAYSSTPICTPARLALLTGLSTARHGLRSYQSSVPPAVLDRPELVSTLAAHGYHTMVVGKNHFGVNENHHFRTHGFEDLSLHEGLLVHDSRSPTFLRQDDYGSWFRSQACHDCDPLASDNNSGPAPWRTCSGATPYNSAHSYVFPYAEHLHPTRWTADAAISAFERWLGMNLYYRQKPLFLKVSFHRPHSPYDPPVRWLRYMLDHASGIASPAIGDWDAHYADDSRCTAANRSYCGPQCGFQAFCGRRTSRDSWTVRLHYYASLSFVDEQAGRVLERLRIAEAEWQRTFVLYLSDHGDALGDHNLWRKGFAYEQVASVPLYVRWPSAMETQVVLPRGSTLPNLVELRDVFPTLADVAGVMLPMHNAPDGLSLLRLLEADGAKTPWRDILMLELALCNFEETNWVALTNGQSKYVRHLANGREQLFDLTTDPYEQRDLSVMNASNTAQWRDRLVLEFQLEERGPAWVLPDGTLPLAVNCTDYQLLQTYHKEEGTLAADSSPARPTFSIASPAREKPNIIFLLSDDQDLLLGGVTPMSQTQRLLTNQGAVGLNVFAHTVTPQAFHALSRSTRLCSFLCSQPICGPSRSQLLTGRYFHNLKIDPRVAHSRPRSENCMHVNTTLVHNHTFAPLLQSAGYTVGLFGKWLNWPADWHNVPNGFDAWFANGGGDYLSPRFIARNIESLGISDGLFEGTPDNYTTSLVGNISISWIRKVANRPFMAYIAVKAAHEPFTPAPWYVDTWEANWPTKEPRTPNWNSSHEARSHHHGTIASAPMLTPTVGRVITGAFRNRWRTLLSFDDVVAATVAECDAASIANRTYFIMTSDHGFQLGQFNIPLDKRHVYDWDTKVPFIIRGPGIAPGSSFDQPATLVDVAPTLLSIAGLSKPDSMDGRSLLPLLVDQTNATLLAALAPATRAHLREVDGPSVRASWRDAVLLEHFFYDENVKCVGNCTACLDCRSHDSNCGDTLFGKQCWSTLGATWKQTPSECTNECYRTESLDNNFVAIRHVSGAGRFADTLYAEFQTGTLESAPIDFTEPAYREFFDAARDPWFLSNQHQHADKEMLSALRAKLWEWLHCTGKACP